MAFPSVEATGGGVGTSPVTDATCPCPATVNAGDLLILWHRAGTGGSLTFPSGFQTLVNASPDTSDDQVGLAWKKADGTEGGTTLHITQASSKYVNLLFRISGAADPDSQPPQISTVATGTNSSPDPTSLSPTGGAKDYLWFWLGSWEGEQTSPPSGFPTNYSTGPYADSTGTGGQTATNCRYAATHRQANAASEDPGSWGLSGPAPWTAYTLAVHPVPPQTRALAATPAGVATLSTPLAVARRVATAPAGVATVTAALTVLPAPKATSVAKLSLAAGGTPLTRTGHAIHVRARIQSGAGTIRVALFEGTTNITGTLESSALSTSLDDYTISILDTDAEEITSYSNLEIQLWGYCVGGNAGVFEVDQVWLETPAAGFTDLAATVAGTGTVSADLKRIRSLAATLQGQATISDQLGPTRTIAASLAGTATETAELTMAQKALAAASSATAQVAGELSTAGGQTRDLAASIPASASLQITGNLSRIVSFAATATGTSSVSASSLAETRGLAASPAGSSSVSTTRIDRTAGVAAVPVGQGSIAAQLSRLYVQLQAAPVGTTTLTADLTSTGGSVTSVARVTLSDPNAIPQVDTGHSIKVRARMSAGANGKIRAALYEGANNRSGDLETGTLTNSLADYTVAISESAASTITDYSNLELRFWGYCPTGGSVTFEIDQIWLEIPNGIVSLAADLAGTSSVSALGKRIVGFDGTSAGSSDVSANIRKTVNFEAQVQGSAYVAAESIRSVRLEATSTGTSSLSAEMSTSNQRLLAAVVTGTSTLSTPLALTRSLAASTAGTATVSAGLAGLQRQFQAGVVGSGAVSVTTLTETRRLACVVTGVGATGANLTTGAEPARLPADDQRLVEKISSWWH